MKLLLVLSFLLIGREVLSQNINLSQLLLLQKQDFNKTNNFFVSNNWEVGEAKEEKNNKSAYTVVWGKGETPNIQVCNITYYQEVVNGNKDVEKEMTQLTYLFTKKEIYNNIKNELESTRYETTKPMISNGVAYSSYTDGYIVVGIGILPTNEPYTIYSVKVEGYIGYYLKQKRD